MNTHIHPTILRHIAWFTPPPQRPDFTQVAQAHASGHAACETCSKNVVVIEHGVEAGKWGCAASSECRLGMWATDRPESCPALQMDAEDTTEESFLQP